MACLLLSVFYKHDKSASSVYTKRGRIRLWPRSVVLHRNLATWSSQSAALHSGHLPLLCRGPLKYIAHTSCLLLEELGILRTLLAPSRVEGSCILINQVGVLSASRAPKVFNLDRQENMACFKYDKSLS